MLEELKKYSNVGSKNDILYFIQKIIGISHVPMYDIRIFCSHVPGLNFLQTEALICFCSFLGLIIFKEKRVHLAPNILELINDDVKLSHYIVSKTLAMSFENNVFSENQFYFDINIKKYIFDNSKLDIKWAAIRNVLVSFNFMSIDINYYKNRFFVSSQFIIVLTKYHKKFHKAMTLARLKKEIEKNAEAGELAEKFVYIYEQRRLANTKKVNEIKMISELDVGAGYDIASFDSCKSVDYDRFIEVKAISKMKKFYWSKNEIETAKYKGNFYFLYLVELSRIKEKGYVPWIIRNPESILFKSQDWYYEPQSYEFRYILFE